LIILEKNCKQCRFCNYWRNPDQLDGTGLCTICQGLSEEIETIGLLKGLEDSKETSDELLVAVTAIIVSKAMGP
jgi:hypothetical protein